MFIPVIIKFTKAKGGSGTISKAYVEALKKGRVKITKLHEEFKNRNKI